MHAEQIRASVQHQGATYSGALWLNHETRFDVGLSPSPDEYDQWFPAMAPAVPAFCRVFSPPGAGLPPWAGPVISSLPPGCLPWISHKDPVPIADVTAYWQTMPHFVGERPYRWTYHHEQAPADNATRLAYVRYWRELHDAAQDFPWIELVQIQTNYAMRWRTDVYWQDWIIGGIALGFDCYPLKPFRYEPPESMFGLLQHAADRYQCPSWGVPELGAEHRDGQNRGSWLLDCTDYLEKQGAAFCGLWCALDKKTGLDYRPTDKATLSTYREILGA